MKKLITLWLLSAYCLSLAAQFPNLSPQYKSKKDKKFNHYNDYANAQLKDGMYRWAAINSLQALKTSEKEKHTEKALILVTQAVPLAFTSSVQTLAGFKTLSEKAPENKKLEYAHEISKIYTELTQIFKQTQDIPAAKGLFGAQVKDYSSNLETANNDLDAVKTQKAEQHYMDALQLETHTSAHWKNRLAVARALKIAHSYKGDHKEINDKLATYRREGVVRVAVSNIYNKTNFVENDWDMSGKISTDWKSQKIPFEFLKLVDFYNNNNADIVMECEVTNLIFQTEKGIPSVDARKKVINKKEEVIAKGTLTTYSRRTYAKVEYAYEIFDVKTGNTLQTKKRSESVVVNFEQWYKCVGDSRVFSKTELVTNAPQGVPNKRVLYGETMGNLKPKLSDILTTFVKPYAY